MRIAWMTVACLVGGSAFGAEIQIGMAGSAYAPKAVKAKVGDTLIFANDDATNHWVMHPKPGLAFSLGSQKEGEARRVTLQQPGVYEIECVFHPEMNMTVEVAP